jgi:hypothetical protein
MGQPRTSSSKSAHLRAPARRVSKLDIEREESMADEGGVSAALLEIEDPKERRALHPGVHRSRVSTPWVIGGLLGIIVVVGFGWLKARSAG